MKDNKYEKKIFCEIVKKSKNITDVARNLGLKPYCGNRRTIIKYIKMYTINISHFQIIYTGNSKNFQGKKLSEILIENSTYDTSNLRNRLYKEGLKTPICELCGQNEEWQGKKMSLILDHINGVHDDHRLENLRIVCPNCNATLLTHGGKNRKRNYIKKIINDDTEIKKIEKNYCSCGNIISKRAKKCNICDSHKQRKTERPTYEQLLIEINELGYSGAGRKYGVSDNAIRKWVKYYKNHE